MATITVNVGVPNAYVVLYDKTTLTSTQALTDGTGKFIFSGLAAGSYSVYNTGIDTTGQNPPTQCGFPAGYTGTVYPRRLDFTLATAASTATATFGYDKPVPWSSLYGGNPPSYGLTTGGGVNLATGTAVNIPTISSNGFGYSIIDNMIYGQCGSLRSDGAGNTVSLNDVRNIAPNNIGDCDFNGILYAPELFGTTNKLSAVCVDPYNPLYLRPLEMYTGGVMREYLTSPYYNVLPKSYTDLADWCYVPTQDAIVWAENAEVWFISLTTPAVWTLPFIGTTGGGQQGINFADMKHLYYPAIGGGITGDIVKVTFTPTVAIGTRLSPANFPTIGDGARAANMPVNFAFPNIRKTVTKSLAADGDLLTYTITIGNLGITPGLTDIFSDTIPPETTFVTGSVYVNGVNQPLANPSSIDIGSLPVGSIQTVTFQVTCSPTLPISEADNTANVLTTYYDSTTDGDYSFSYKSNTVTTTIISSYLDITKSVSKPYGQINDTITYTIIVSNPTTTTAYSTKFFDTIPLGSIYIPNTFVVNGVTKPSSTFTPPSGYLLGTIAAGARNTITFQVSAVSVPSNNLINNISGINYVYRFTTSLTLPINGYSNEVNTSLNFVDLSGINKSVNKSYTSINSTITYTIVIPNNGNTTAYDCIFIDTLPNGVTYENNTLTVNGNRVSGSPSNISLGDIPAGGVVTISYVVLIN
ncbi:MAG: hypothetical protein ACRC7N_04890 [Clostridium sp.]